MTRSAQYLSGRREAEKAAVAWLHEEAERMTDRHARVVLHGAAFSLGVHFAQTTKADIAKSVSETGADNG